MAGSETFVHDEAAATPAASGDVATLSFEQSLAELERIVQDLERGQLDLEAAIKAFDRGTELRRHCADKLKEAQLKVEKILVSADGQIASEPADLD